jgi:hypothetical protein
MIKKGCTPTIQLKQSQNESQKEETQPIGTMSVAEKKESYFQCCFSWRDCSGRKEGLMLSSTPFGSHGTSSSLGAISNTF